MKKQHEELWAQPPIGLSTMRLTNGTGHGAQRCSRGRAGAPRSVQPRGRGAGTTSPPAAGTPALALWFWVYAFAFSAVRGPPTSAICFSVKFSCKGSQHVVLENQHVKRSGRSQTEFSSLLHVLVSRKGRGRPGGKARPLSASRREARRRRAVGTPDQLCL